MIDSIMQNRFKKITGTLFFVECLLFIIGLMVGTVPLHPAQLFSFGSSQEINFLLKLRFEREVMALCCGGMLAIGSVILQGLTCNSMVAPDLMGMTSFACAFIIIIIICEMFFIKSVILNAALGVIGAIIGFLCCLFLSKNHRTNHRLSLVLVGVSLSFSLSALIQLLILKTPENMSVYLQFLTGSLYAVSQTAITISFLFMLITVPIAFILSKHFVIFFLDDQSACSLGVPLKTYRIICFFVAVVLIGSSVMGVGQLGFLGVVAPNIARLFIGNRPRYIFPLSFLTGAIIYLLADILGRCLISPAEIPAGIMANIIGAPLFLYILFRYYRGQNE
jgi:iron complex transport system permease protein